MLRKPYLQNYKHVTLFQPKENPFVILMKCTWIPVLTKHINFKFQGNEIETIYKSDDKKWSIIMKNNHFGCVHNQASNFVYHYQKINCFLNKYCSLDLINKQSILALTRPDGVINGMC